MKPEDIVAHLSNASQDFSARIGCMTKEWSSSASKVSGRFFYVPFRDSKPTVDELVAVAHARMINFAIPRARINEALAALAKNPGVMDPIVILTTEARDLFIKTQEETGRSGELGEMLLYMLLEWVLKAPIVACKMYLKTSLQMPIHGTDGIHLGSDGGSLILYWGESKLHAELSSALTDIIKSVDEQAGSREKIDNEVRIIRSNLNLDHASSEARDAVKKYFDPYSQESNKLLHSYACLAGFNSKIYENVSHLGHDVCEEEFKKAYEKRIDQAGELILKKIKEAKMDALRFDYFLLPFPSVDDARAAFQKKLWGKQ